MVNEVISDAREFVDNGNVVFVEFCCRADPRQQEDLDDTMRERLSAMEIRMTHLRRVNSTSAKSRWINKRKRVQRELSQLTK